MRLRLSVTSGERSICRSEEQRARPSEPALGKIATPTVAGGGGHYKHSDSANAAAGALAARQPTSGLFHPASRQSSHHLSLWRAGHSVLLMQRREGAHRSRSTRLETPPAGQPATPHPQPWPIGIRPIPLQCAVTAATQVRQQAAQCIRAVKLVGLPEIFQQ
jgi:hypothetical protein